MINDTFTFLSTVNNLKAPPEEFWLGGDNYRATRKDEMRSESRVDAVLSRVLSSQFCRFGRKLWRRPSVFSKYELPNAVIEHRRPCTADSGAACRSAEEITLKSACSNKVEYGVSNSSDESLRNSGNRQRLQNVWSKRQSAFDRRTYDLIYVADSSDQERIEEADCQKTVEEHQAQSDQ